MALLLFRIAIGAERFPLDLDRSGSLGLLGSFGHHLLSTGAEGAGASEGATTVSETGAFSSAAFLAVFAVFVFTAVFGADLTVLILVLGASTEAASATAFFQLRRPFWW